MDRYRNSLDEIEAGHVFLATVLTIIICSYFGFIEFPNDGLAVFIVLWLIALAGVWKFRSK